MSSPIFKLKIPSNGFKYCAHYYGYIWIYAKRCSIPNFFFAASLHHDSEDSAEYQSPEEVADYQKPKSSEYQPPSTHYQMPPSNRPKSGVGPLDDKPWFHGNISRIDAEMLVEKDGQFLVRESSSTKGQYVLSGMKDGQHRHLLLVDPQGQVIAYIKSQSLSSMPIQHPNFRGTGSSCAKPNIVYHVNVMFLWWFSNSYFFE